MANTSTATHESTPPESFAPIVQDEEAESKYEKEINDKDTDDVSIQEPERVHTKSDRLDMDDDIEKQSTRRDTEASPNPAARVVTAQDWTSPDDPENPMNWSLRKKAYHTAVPGLFAFVVCVMTSPLLQSYPFSARMNLADALIPSTFGSSVYSPAIPGFSQYFHVSNEVSVLGISLYTLGTGFGPMIAAPMSETFGRLIVYRLSLPLSLLFIMGAGFSKTLGTFMTMRLLGGIAGSPVLSVGAGTNADLFPPRQRAQATTFFLVAPFLGPAMGYVPSLAVV